LPDELFTILVDLFTAGLSNVTNKRLMYFIQF